MPSPKKANTQKQGLSKCPLKNKEEYSALKTNVPFPLILVIAKTEIILRLYPVRIHSRISRQPWARLWYLCRALDTEGTGRVVLPLPGLQLFLDCSDKSIYRWLQQGKKLGAFRRYQVKTGEIWLGSMFNVCRKLNLRLWGAVGVEPVAKILSLIQLRALTTGVVTQRFQQKSRYAANCILKPEHRKLYGAPHPNELLGNSGQSSLKSAAGQVPFVLHISESRVFVSKSFTNFGTSQNTISCELGIHTRTVRRHQKLLGMEKRQLCKTKQEYAQLNHALQNEMSESWAFIGTKTDVGYQVVGDVTMFSDGIPLGAKKQQPNSYQIPAGQFSGRFFKVGNKTFMNGCNLYREDFTLTRMTAARRKYHQQLSQCQKSENRGGRIPDIKIGCPVVAGI